MTNRGDRFVRPGKMFDEGDSVFVRAQGIRIGDAAGEQQRIEILGSRL